MFFHCFHQVFHCVHFETPSQEARLAMACTSNPATLNTDTLVVPVQPSGVDLSPRPSVNMNPCLPGMSADRSVAQGMGPSLNPVGAEGGGADMLMCVDLAREMQDTPESERHDIEEEGNNSDIEGR